MMIEFSLANLQALDNGRVVEAFNQAVKRVVGDCQDRPALKKARKVTLEMEVVPVFAQDGAGGLDSIKAVFKVTDTAPKRESKEYSFGCHTRKGKPELVFNDLSDDNVHQRTIDE